MRVTLLSLARGFLALLAFVAAAACLRAETVSSAQESPVIQLLSSSEGKLQLQINRNEPISMEALQAREIPLSQEGITISAKNGTWSVSAKRPCELHAAFSPAFRATLPAGNSLGFAAKLPLDFSTPDSNGAAIRFIFPDRGEARMAGGSFARYEPFSGNTYSFAGRGHVKVTSADGVEFECSALVPPLMGGELAPNSGKADPAHLARKTPLTRVALVPDKNGKVTLKLNQETVQIAERELKEVALPDGTRFSLKVDSARSALDLDVQKGVCQFTIDGFPYWKAVAVSGQSANVRWNAQGKQIDIRNKTTSASPVNGELLLNLSSHINASVAPGATFQYSQLYQAANFATAATGGEVKIFNAETGETTSVQTHNVLFTQGSPSGNRAAVDGLFDSVQLNWDTDKAVQLRGSQGTVAVGLNHSDTLKVSDSSLEVKYGQDGMLTLRAKRGNFQIRPDFVQDLAFEVPQGGALLAQVNRRDMSLSARLAEGNDAEVRASVGGSFSNPFTPESVLTLLFQRRTYFDAKSANNLNWIFFEGAGGDGRTFSTAATAPSDSSAGFRPQQVPIDVSRIPQEPVSVIE